MDVIKLKPEREQKTLWIITWVVFFVIGILLWIVLSITVDLLIFGITIFTWLIIMIPVIVWIPAAFNALEYYIDDEGVKMRGGVVWKKHVTVPYLKITNVDVTQGPLQRCYKIGTIHIQTAGAAGKQGEKAELRMTGIRELEKVRDVIIKKVKGLAHPSGRAEESKGRILSEEKMSIFTDMLKELKEIKSLLRKEQ